MVAPVQIRSDLQLQITGTSTLVGSRGKPYRATPGLLSAVNVALELERPLLLTGEPGCGKTDFAFACARALGVLLGHSETERELLNCSVRSDTRAKDLLYTHDAVRRFGEAQYGGDAGRARASDPRHYVELQPLGRALASSRRRVVLIDEVDKAPRDLPNDLLRELDKGEFSIPEIPDTPATADEVFSHGILLRKEMKRPRVQGQPDRLSPKPLIIITSNSENQLPDPFLRRCVFWDVKFPTDLLPEILEDHFPEQPDDLLTASLNVFHALRRVSGLTKVPGTAELLDWMNALVRVIHPDDTQKVVDFAARSGAGGRQIRWLDLPALCCLIKLREDLELLGRA
jgi:MoxR-like ATPase